MARLNQLSARFLAIVICSIPLCVQAGNLTVVNNTNFDSTTITNNFSCSDHLPGGKGITKAHSTNVIPENTVNVACIRNKDNCKADVYLTANCTGPMVATVIFDVKNGIKSVAVHDSKYKISGTGFYITLDG